MIFESHEKVMILRRIQQGEVICCSNSNNYAANVYECSYDEDEKLLYCDEGYLSPGGTWYSNNITIVADMSGLKEKGIEIPLRFDIFISNNQIIKCI